MGQVRMPYLPLDPWDLLGLQLRFHDHSVAEKVGVKVGAVHT